jgi:superfamily I DNA/RNA helicase
MPEEGQDVQAEAKLLYVAMTRSTEKLLLTYHQETVFTRLMQGHQTELVTH